MIKQWHDLLRASQAGTQSALDSADQLASYCAADSLQISALSGHVIYEITGADAQSFLQGQFCNDLAQVSFSQAQVTGYCTPKGRLLALPVILGFDNGYRLLVPADIAPAFIKRLSMFVMRSDVQITHLDEWVAMGITVSSQDKPEDLAGTLGELPAGELSVNTTEDAQLIRWHDDHSGDSARKRYLRLGSVESQSNVWSRFAEAGKSSENTWRLGDISAGIPSIREGVLEAFVPQMMNLQLINGLSFKKGCYPGQEIVARMQYLGKLKRHMRVFSMSYKAQDFDVNANLQPGKGLCIGADENAGVVVDAMPTGPDSALVLAVTKVTSGDDTLTLHGVPLTGCKMPYELPTLEVA